MPRGYPDWGRIRKEVGIAAIGDLGELAVRLGASVVWDRRGDVVLVDSFDLGLAPWDISNLTLTASHELSCEQFLHGGFSLKLDPGTQVATSHRVWRKVPDIGPTRAGAEIAFLFFTGFDYITLFLNYTDGEYIRYFRLIYDYPERAIKYVDENDTLVTVKEGVYLTPGERTWHYIKLTADLESGEYVRGIVDRIEVNLEGKFPFKEETTVAPALSAQVEITPALDTNNVVYLDAFVLTQNEP